MGLDAGMGATVVLESVPNRVIFRPDAEVKAALVLLAARFETDNVSEAVRTAIMVAADRAQPVEAVVLRRARMEGVLAGLALLRRQMGAALDVVLAQVQRSSGSPEPREEVPRGEGEAVTSAIHPDAGR